jgi:hypothetical protein
MREADLQDEIRLALGQVPGLALWRNNVGVGAVGRAQTRVRFGLSVGSADLIGVVRMDSGIGRFIALEVKTAAGSVSPAQRQWLQLVSALGGYAAIVRSVEGALDAVEAARRGET